MQDLFCENRITGEVLIFNSCDINDEEILTIVGKLLGATEATNFWMFGHRSRNFHFKKEFVQSASEKKLKGLGFPGKCDFFDDDLSATEYVFVPLERCHISECALRRFLEDLFECRRDIVNIYVTLQKKIDVDRLLNNLPSIEKTSEREWNLRNIRGSPVLSTYYSTSHLTIVNINRRRK
uniref:Uncharacterized protein n=1 Tax=Heterorhabditis bacteriophora TaxID=37862 RepID=A0A1I7W6E5_HETBA